MQDDANFRCLFMCAIPRLDSKTCWTKVPCKKHPVIQESILDASQLLMIMNHELRNLARIKDDDRKQSDVNMGSNVAAVQLVLAMFCCASANRIASTCKSTKTTEGYFRNSRTRSEHSLMFCHFFQPMWFAGAVQPKAGCSISARARCGWEAPKSRRLGCCPKLYRCPGFRCKRIPFLHTPSI